MSETAPHVIRQGEYLLRLCEARGLDVAAVWALPENAALRERRASHFVLAPGDVVHLPVREPEPLRLSRGQTNAFRVRRARVSVSVTLRGAGEPLAREPFVVELPGDDEVAGFTDDRGVATFEVPMHLEVVTMQLPARDHVVRVAVGHLDPRDTDAGVAHRLENLGFLDDDVDFLGEAERRARVRDALRAFQEARGLSPTGELDDDTATALEQAHGR